MTYSLSRFGIYETVRDKMNRENKGLMPFYQKVLLGIFGGSCCCTYSAFGMHIFISLFNVFSPTGFAGGFIGTPADLVNVR